MPNLVIPFAIALEIAFMREKYFLQGSCEIIHSACDARNFEIQIALTMEANGNVIVRTFRNYAILLQQFRNHHLKLGLQFLWSFCLSYETWDIITCRYPDLRLRIPLR